MIPVMGHSAESRLKSTDCCLKNWKTALVNASTSTTTVKSNSQKSPKHFSTSRPIRPRDAKPDLISLLQATVQRRSKTGKFWKQNHNGKGWGTLKNIDRKWRRSIFWLLHSSLFFVIFWGKITEIDKILLSFPYVLLIEKVKNEK